ncbi:MAG: hypothetical protein AB1384_12320 [Actinomycetota bacterium]
MRKYLLDENKNEIVGFAHVKRRKTGLVYYGILADEDFQSEGKARLVEKKDFKDQIRGMDLKEWDIRQLS